MCAHGCVTHTILGPGWLEVTPTTAIDFGKEFALYADESLEWAEYTLPTALEDWPDE